MVATPTTRLKPRVTPLAPKDTVNYPVRMNRCLLGVFLGLCAFGSRAAAQAGAGAPVLSFPISARSAGMGETGVADNTDPDNLYYNPANAVGRPSIYIEGSRWDLLPEFNSDVWIGGMRGGARWNSGDRVRWGADFAYSRLDYGESITTDPSGMPIGEVHPIEEYFALTGGVGLAVGNRGELRIGSAVKRVNVDYGRDDLGGIPDAKADTYAFDIGATFAFPASLGEWTVVPALATAFINLGPDLDFPNGNSDPLPTRFNFGTSVRVVSPTVRLFAADVPVVTVVYNVEGTDRWHNDDFSWAIGSELTVVDMLYVRAGITDFHNDMSYERESDPGWGVGFGLPIGPVRARFDFTKSPNYISEEKKYGAALEWLL